MNRRAWKPQSHRWVVSEPSDQAEVLARELQTSPLVAQILLNRNLRDPDRAKEFLRPKLTDLLDPETLSGCSIGAVRLAKAVREREPIVLYGDYDVDGMTGVAILHALLGMVDANVSHYIPNRLEEGYGVNADAIRSILDDGAKLIVTIDCGISAAEPLAIATNGGVDVIVTDHHSLHDDRPEVAATVHPALDGYANPDLCGAGVAMKLAWQTARELCGKTRVDEQFRTFLIDATCLAAVGTIADVVPLLGENRVLASFGLQALPATTHVGLRALLQEGNLVGKTLEGHHVGFVLGPRLNAAGRMGQADLAMELLTTTDRHRAAEIAGELSSHNTERQTVERAITETAIQMVREGGMDQPDRRAIVLHSNDWHGGVIGIVASRLVDRFHRPTVLIATDDNGVGQGSARSIPGFHIAEGLQQCAAHLLSHGGHEMAGGLRIAQENILAFTEAFTNLAGERLTVDQLTPALRADAETTLDALGMNTVRQLEAMAPFGPKNPRPVVILRDCRLLGAPRRMGRNGQAVNMMLQQGQTSMRAVGFSMGDLADHLAAVRRVDIAARPVLNTFNGRTNVELHLLDVLWD
jgi:single-stranded-DNA-specific exonuclease